MLSWDNMELLEVAYRTEMASRSDVECIYTDRVLFSDLACKNNSLIQINVGLQKCTITPSTIHAHIEQKIKKTN
jgi:hypothetical protein